MDSDYISDFDNIILSNMDEYHDFMSDSEEWGKEYKLELSSDKYDEAYFEDKSIGLIYVNIGSSMNEWIGVKISNNDNTLIVEPNIKWATGIVTDDITGKLILVEVGKNITKIEQKDK